MVGFVQRSVICDDVAPRFVVQIPIHDVNSFEEHRMSLQGHILDRKSWELVSDNPVASFFVVEAEEDILFGEVTLLEQTVRVVVKELVVDGCYPREFHEVVGHPGVL